MDEHFSRETAAPVPRAVAYVRDLLDGFGPAWVLCGGWAADAWLGRQTRDHGDVDIAVFHPDQRAIAEHFPGWALVGHDPNVPGDTTEHWDGRHLDLPAHIHVPERGSPLSTSADLTHPAFEFEFLLNERSGDDWILNREHGIAVPLHRGVRPSRWGLPTAVPEVVLFFKAGGHLTAAEARTANDVLRPRDEQDLFALLPALTAGRRSWLAQSLGTVRPEHRWLAHLRS
ncbi:nucleotidyltransferase domain-containing protein [Nonomuraea terrae]|uniref:nucleotidyltransferase domain-containing protein n=1 Tax=Nonomuraea terrae TaxID=2530383 RepID=UPI0037BE1DAA